MATLVDALTRELDKEAWAFRTVPTTVAAVKHTSAGEGCAFGFCTGRWTPVCEQPIPFQPVAQSGSNAFRRAPDMMLLRPIGVAGDDKVLALVSVHLTSRSPGGDRGPDGLKLMREEVDRGAARRRRVRRVAVRPPRKALREGADLLMPAAR
jgi:hypothetical protein